MPKKVYTQAYASLRFTGPNLDPLDVTKALRLPPDDQYRAGEPRLKRTLKGKVEEFSPYRFGFWCMSSKPWVQSSRLETHIEWMLKQLEPLKDTVLQLKAEGADVDFFCYSLGATDQPPSLSRMIRRRAEAIGIRIDIDHYVEYEERTS